MNKSDWHASEAPRDGDLGHPMLADRLWILSKAELELDGPLTRTDWRFDLGACELVAGYRDETPVLLILNCFDEQRNALISRDPIGDAAPYLGTESGVGS